MPKTNNAAIVTIRRGDDVYFHYGDKVKRYDSETTGFITEILATNATYSPFRIRVQWNGRRVSYEDVGSLVKVRS